MHHPTGNPLAAHRQMVVSRRQAAPSPGADAPQGAAPPCSCLSTGIPAERTPIPQRAESKASPEAVRDDCLRLIGVVSPSVNQVLVPDDTGARRLMAARRPPTRRIAEVSALLRSSAHARPVWVQTPSRRGRRRARCTVPRWSARCQSMPTAPRLGPHRNFARPPVYLLATGGCMTRPIDDKPHAVVAWRDRTSAQRAATTSG
jgi:hypothetical protein